MVVFPELEDHRPDGADLVHPAMLALLGCYGSARELTAAPLAELAALLGEHSAGRWGEAQASELQALARHSAASTRAVGFNDDE